MATKAAWPRTSTSTNGRRRRSVKSSLLAQHVLLAKLLAEPVSVDQELPGRCGSVACGILHLLLLDEDSHLAGNGDCRRYTEPQAKDVSRAASNCDVIKASASLHHSTNYKRLDSACRRAAVEFGEPPPDASAGQQRLPNLYCGANHSDLDAELIDHVDDMLSVIDADAAAGNIASIGKDRTAAVRKIASELKSVETWCGGRLPDVVPPARSSKLSEPPLLRQSNSRSLGWASQAERSCARDTADFLNSCRVVAATAGAAAPSPKHKPMARRQPCDYDGSPALLLRGGSWTAAVAAAATQTSFPVPCEELENGGTAQKRCRRSLSSCSGIGITAANCGWHEAMETSTAGTLMRRQLWQSDAILQWPSGSINQDGRDSCSERSCFEWDVAAIGSSAVLPPWESCRVNAGPISKESDRPTDGRQLYFPLQVASASLTSAGGERFAPSASTGQWQLQHCEWSLSDWSPGNSYACTENQTWHRPDDAAGQSMPFVASWPQPQSCYSSRCDYVCPSLLQ